MLAAANRDERKRAGVQAPRHRPPARRPHGAGPGMHGCVGQAVARLGGELVPGALGRKVKAIEPAGPPTRSVNNTRCAAHMLPLHLMPA